MTTVARAYAAQANDPSFPEHWSGPPELVDRIARLVGTRGADRVVDVATGVGGPARRLAEITGCEVVGVDVVFDAVRRAARSRPGRVRFVAGTAAALPLGSRIADQVWCLGALAHIEDLDAFVAEAARVLRPGGVIAITEAFSDGRPPRFLRTAPRPWRPFTVGALGDSLRRGGFAGVRPQPWPAAIEESPPADPRLAADLRDGRLRPALVTARRA